MADSSHSTLFKGLEMGDIKVKNARGSSAGAGSGDCHHYLQGRRAELFRIERLQEESEKAKKDKEWQEELDARVAASEAEKAKRAAKRNKKKQKRKPNDDNAPDAKKPKIEETVKDDVHEVKQVPTADEPQNKDEEIKAKVTTGIVLSDD